MNTGKYKRLISDTAIFSLSSFGSKILIFLMVPLYTHVLVAQEYGVIDTITTMTGLLQPVMTLLIYEAALRFALEKGREGKHILSCVNVMILGSSLILLFAKPLVALLGGEWSLLGEYWLWICGLYFLNSFNTSLGGYARGREKMKLFAVSGILYTVVVICANLILLLALDMGIEGYLLAMIIADVVCILHKLVFGGFFRELCSFSFNKELLREMLRYSIPMVPSTIAWWVMQLSDKYVIIGCWGVAASGIYSIAYKIPSILSAISNVFSQAWRISAIKNKDEADNRQFVGNVIGYVTTFSIGISSVLIALAEPLGRILYSGEYYIAWHYVPMLIAAYHFSGLSGVLASLYSAEKKTGMLFISTSVGAALNIILNLIFIPTYGVVCAAYTTMFSFFVTWLIRMVHVRTIVPFAVNVTKTCISIAVLITQAILISLNVPYGYLISVVAIVAQIILYWDVLKQLIIMAAKIVRRVVNKGEKK